MGSIVIKGNYIKNVPFKCPQCQNQFGEQDTMESVITGDQKFVDIYCPVCSKLNKERKEQGFRPKDREYVYKQKLARIMRPEDDTSGLA